jgi:hypothetical protein
MKITKSHLKQIIKEELQNVLEESRYDSDRDRRLVDYGSSKTYDQKFAAARRRTKQTKYSNDMIKQGKADALEGIPRNKNIVHLGYHKAYDKAFAGQTDVDQKGEDARIKTETADNKSADHGDFDRSTGRPQTEKGRLLCVERPACAEKFLDAEGNIVDETDHVSRLRQNMIKIYGSSRNVPSKFKKQMDDMIETLVKEEVYQIYREGGEETGLKGLVAEEVTVELLPNGFYRFFDRGSKLQGLYTKDGAHHAGDFRIDAALALKIIRGV